MYESKEMAAFNLALPYLTRVNSILNANYVEFKNKDAGAFALNLRQLYRELYPWLRENDIIIIKKYFLQLSKIPQPNRDMVWRKMEDIENLMRAHFKQLGMLMPKVEDPRFLFGKRQK